MAYDPSYPSLKQHAVPDWFGNAKLGIFVHWGLFSVPGWAPTTGDLDKVVEQQGWAAWFAQNPYAEWYQNSIKFENSPSRRYHTQTYGADTSYDDFVPMFNDAIKNWQPDAWADLFERAGARYAVLVTKHHDGFLLWPSAHGNPFKPGYQAARDIAGELTEAVRQRGLQMGLYYSGGLDWTFKPDLIHDFSSLFAAIPQDEAYVAYADAHWRELIEHYQPALMWNDIGYPAAADLPQLFADYYNAVPDGVINDRFRQAPSTDSQAAPDPQAAPPANEHWDFRTPEYARFDQIMTTKWESTRGIGHSFGYNRNEGPEHYLPLDTLIRMFVDVVSKNGNLLLNVGPMADGTIPDLQRERLEGLGAWLAVNGAAIFDTRPWHAAEGQTQNGIDVRYTQKDDSLYATLLNTPSSNQVVVTGLHADPHSSVTLLGHEQPLAWTQDGTDLIITLPDAMPDAPAHSLQITPQPHLHEVAK